MMMVSLRPRHHYYYALLASSVGSCCCRFFSDSTITVAAALSLRPLAGSCHHHLSSSFHQRRQQQQQNRYITTTTTITRLFSSFTSDSSSPSPLTPSSSSSSQKKPNNDDDNNIKDNDTTTTDTKITQCIPPITPHSYKGSSGRIGILGGSERYTGAPYYAAMAALRVGADLATVFCATEAAVPIKSYSPELMVASVYSTAAFDEAMGREGDEGDAERERLVAAMVQSVTSSLDKLHVLLIGPGLGRHPLVMRATAEIIAHVTKKRDKNCPIVLDADALYLLTLDRYKDLLRNDDDDDDDDDGRRCWVLTPNAYELKNLKQMWEMNGNDDGGVIIAKGRHDHIMLSSSSRDNDDETTTTSLICEEEGGMKRSGGIGDVLAGTVATFVAWRQLLHKQQQQQTLPTTMRPKDDEKEEQQQQSNDDDDDDDDDGNNDDSLLLLSCWSACCVAKRATNRAWHKMKRGMTASDVLEEVPGTVDDIIRRGGGGYGDEI